MQPPGCDVVYFVRLQETNTLSVLRWIRPKSLITSSTGKKRAPLQAKAIEQKFLPVLRFGAKNESPRGQRAFVKLCHFKKSGAGEGIRTLDPDLGKVVLYP